MMIALFVVCLILLAAILVMGWRLMHTMRAGSRVREFQAEIARSPKFYAPMDRLLSETDFQYLKTRPEIPQSSIDRMRRERRKIFRRYLGCLASDFAAITSEIRAVMAFSEFSRGDLAKTLVRARVIFTLAMLSMEVRLFIHACGIHGVGISAARLTEGLAEMRRELRLLSPAAALSV